MLADCHFNIIDSWFFREAKGLDAIGSGVSNSLFPPPVNTLAGALRTSIGDHLKVDWRAYAQNKSLPEHHTLLGSGSNLGSLALCGPFLHEKGHDTSPATLLYPAPAALLCAVQVDNGHSTTSLHRLSIGAQVRCDMGYVALPQLKPTAPPGSKPLENTWITSLGLQQWLSGDTPASTELRALNDLICSDNRLGIGRNNATSTTTDGLLYQTQHVRLKNPNLSVYLQVDGIPKDYYNGSTNHAVRLGGEGREASIKLTQSATEWRAPAATQCKAIGLTLMLVTAVKQPDNTGLQPLPGFKPVSNDAGQLTHWHGEIAGVALDLISSAMPRMTRIGGWDQQNHHAKPLKSVLAPGTVFYCKLATQETALEDAINALNGHRIGQEQAFGYGQLVAGYWPQQDSAS